jgi:hypothetical protein
LTFHHSWSSPLRPYDAGEHALIGCSPDLDSAESALAPLVTAASLAAAADQVPDEWLAHDTAFESVDAARAAYVAALLARFEARSEWMPALRETAESGGRARVIARNRPAWLNR